MKLLISFWLLGFATSWAQIELQLQSQNNKNNQNTISDKFSEANTKLVVAADLFKLKVFPNEKNQDFIDFQDEKFSFLQNPGEAQVPFIARVVTAMPDDINALVNRGEPYVLEKSLIAPAQEEDCRCSVNKKSQYRYKAESYTLNTPLIEKQYLGKFRGVPLTRVLFKLAQSDKNLKSTYIFPKAKLTIESSSSLKQNFFQIFKKKDLDYLIITPEKLLPGLKKWVNFKKRHFFKIKTVVLKEGFTNTAVEIKKLIKNEYDKSHFEYALIVGDADQVATNLVRTSGSNKTQSDYPYSLMDGSDDIIPDVQFGRVVASDAIQVEYQTTKWIKYERKQKFNHMIGIASNEGSNPSDDDYIKSIEKNLSTSYNTTIDHFYQDDINSNPTFLNKVLGEGVSWLTYIGHGSGKSWPSMDETYSTKSIIDQMSSDFAKPIVIDVACQNGKLNAGYFGERMVNEGAKTFNLWQTTFGNAETKGAAMYYGGSVNISWHPPAIMAQGMIIKKIENDLKTLGDTILAGHLYLIENYSNMNEIKDNFAWYHLFGDPSAKVRF